MEENQRKVTKRRVLSKFGGLTSADAQKKLYEIKRKEEHAEAKRQQKAIDKFLRNERKEMHQKGVQARRLERERKRKIKELDLQKQEVPSELLIPIPDPEKVWLAEKEQSQLQLKEPEHEQEEEQEQELTFIIDEVGDRSLQPLPEYIALPTIESDENESSEGSDTYDSGEEYVFFGMR